ncbi:DNA recombination protein RmuC [bacterium]|jgi:DNA recombination protein RmuC|nr:DNA recombination protein RmuC [bacterium]
MEMILLILVLTILAIIIALSVFMLKKTANDPLLKVDSFLKDNFLSFQSNINKELNQTRSEISRSKDLISEHTLKTVDSIKDINLTIQKIISQQEESHRLGESLKDILQAPKLRGSYGEAILEEMLGQALPKGLWERQYSIEGREQVDAVIKMKNLIIPIDAKFPRDNYQKYISSATDEEKTKYWKEYEKDLKKHIKDIKDKYIKPEKGTSEFALMFIPSESIYYETITEKNFMGHKSEIFDFAQKNKVVPISPNTFYAFLQIVVSAIRNTEIIKSIKHIQEGLSYLEKDFEKFYRKYEEVGKYIEKASEAFRIGDSHVERYKKRLSSTLELEGLSSGQEKTPEEPSEEK